VTSRTCRRHHRLQTATANTSATATATGSGGGGGGDGRILSPVEPCAQEVYIITLPVDGIQLQSLILTGTGVGSEATLSYSPASSDGVESKALADEHDPDIGDVEDVCDKTESEAVLDVEQKAPCSGLDTLAAVADRLRQEMLDEEAAEHGETRLDGLFCSVC